MGIGLRRTSAAVFAFLAGAALQAQSPIVLGPEFQVNATTTNLQYASGVAADGTGRFIVAWQQQVNVGDPAQVIARRFDDDGTPLSGELQVSTPTGVNEYPAVAADSDGDFVVVWTGPVDGDGKGIGARRYDATGTPAGAEFVVNTVTTGDQNEARVAMHADGSFVVVWSTQYAIAGRRYDASGNPLGAEFPIGAVTTIGRNNPDVAAGPGGTFIVTWRNSLFEDPDLISAQRFDASGSPAGPEITVNQAPSGSRPAVRVAPDGSFVVAYEGYVPSQVSDVWARVFDADGTPETDEFRVNTYTPSFQGFPSVAAEPTGDFLIAWSGPAQAGDEQVYAQRYDAEGRRRGGEFLLNAYTTGDQYVAAIAANPSGRIFLASNSLAQDGSSWGVFGRIAGFPDAEAASVDAHESAGASNLNGVLEPGERVLVETAWHNASDSALPLTGTASGLTGPAGPTYTIDDSSANYVSIPAGDDADCFTATGNCYEVTVAGARPAPHWDATFTETLSTGGTKTWTLHVGESFPDVAPASPFYRFIESLFHEGVTGGCAGGNYCPGNAVTRSQMAVFLLKAKHGASYVPPACGGVFPDVACPSLFADWIEQLAAEGITGGCGGGNYCPDNVVTRKQMAVFLLKAADGSDYVPPAAAGIFGDVPQADPFAPWIEELYARQVTGGCSASPLLYCPGNPNTRGQMAVFLTKTFDLQLYGGD